MLFIVDKKPLVQTIIAKINERFRRHMEDPNEIPYRGECNANYL
jgi:hypothetical protein